MGENRKLKIIDLISSDGFTKDEYIQQLYHVLLRRNSDEASFQKLLQRSDTQRFFKEFLGSSEFRSKSHSATYIPGLRLTEPNRKRILLFGAYGNGNLGDKIQAESLSRVIKHVDPSIEVWACSVLGSTFPFAYDFVLPASALSKPQIVNDFDMLVIGGGGLLSHPHDPLTQLEWQRQISIPIAFVGIGAATEVAILSETLLRKAFYVSVRDEHSMSSIQRIIGDARLAPDPVLCDSMYQVNDFDKSQTQGRITNGCKLWILKNAPWEQLEQFRSKISPEDEVCFLEPALDFPLIAMLPRAKPIYRAEQLIDLIDLSNAVISMRYHGCILAMLRDKPTIAVKEHKSLDLMRKYGNEHYFVRDAGEVSFDFARYRSPREFLIQDRARLVAEVRVLLQCPEPKELTE